MPSGKKKKRETPIHWEDLVYRMAQYSLMDEKDKKMLEFYQKLEQCPIKELPIYIQSQIRTHGEEVFEYRDRLGFSLLQRLIIMLTDEDKEIFRQLLQMMLATAKIYTKLLQDNVCQKLLERSEINEKEERNEIYRIFEETDIENKKDIIDVFNLLFFQSLQLDDTFTHTSNTVLFEFTKLKKPQLMEVFLEEATDNSVEIANLWFTLYKPDRESDYSRSKNSEKFTERKYHLIDEALMHMKIEDIDRVLKPFIHKQNKDGIDLLFPMSQEELEKYKKNQNRHRRGGGETAVKEKSGYEVYRELKLNQLEKLRKQQKTKEIVEAILQSVPIFYALDLSNLIIDKENHLNTNLLSDYIRKGYENQFISMVSYLKHKSSSLNLDLDKLINKSAQDGRSIAMRVISVFSQKIIEEFKEIVGLKFLKKIKVANLKYGAEFGVYGGKQNMLQSLLKNKVITSKQKQNLIDELDLLPQAATYDHLGQYPINYLVDIMNEKNPDDIALFNVVLKACKSVLDYKYSIKDIQLLQNEKLQNNIDIVQCIKDIKNGHKNVLGKQKDKKAKLNIIKVINAYKDKLHMNIDKVNPLEIAIIRNLVLTTELILNVVNISPLNTYGSGSQTYLELAFSINDLKIAELSIKNLTLRQIGYTQRPLLTLMRIKKKIDILYREDPEQYPIKKAQQLLVQLESKLFDEGVYKLASKEFKYIEHEGKNAYLNLLVQNEEMKDYLDDELYELKNDKVQLNYFYLIRDALVNYKYYNLILRIDEKIGQKPKNDKFILQLLQTPAELNDADSMNFVWDKILSEADRKRVEVDEHIQTELIKTMFIDYKDIISVYAIKEFKGAAKLQSVPKFISKSYDQEKPMYKVEMNENESKEHNSKLAKYNLSKRKHFRDQRINKYAQQSKSKVQRYFKEKFIIDYETNAKPLQKGAVPLKIRQIKQQEKNTRFKRMFTIENSMLDFLIPLILKEKQKNPTKFTFMSYYMTASMHRYLLIQKLIEKGQLFDLIDLRNIEDQKLLTASICSISFQQSIPLLQKFFEQLKSEAKKTFKKQDITSIKGASTFINQIRFRSENSKSEIPGNKWKETILKEQELEQKQRQLEYDTSDCCSVFLSHFFKRMTIPYLNITTHNISQVRILISQLFELNAQINIVLKNVNFDKDIKKQEKFILKQRLAVIISLGNQSRYCPIDRELRNNFVAMCSRDPSLFDQSLLNTLLAPEPQMHHHIFNTYDFEAALFGAIHNKNSDFLEYITQNYPQLLLETLKLQNVQEPKLPESQSSKTNLNKFHNIMKMLFMQQQNHILSSKYEKGLPKSEIENTSKMLKQMFDEETVNFTYRKEELIFKEVEQNKGRRVNKRIQQEAGKKLVKLTSQRANPFSLLHYVVLSLKLCLHSSQSIKIKAPTLFEIDEVRAFLFNFLRRNPNQVGNKKKTTEEIINAVFKYDIDNQITENQLKSKIGISTSILNLLSLPEVYNAIQQTYIKPLIQKCTTQNFIDKVKGINGKQRYLQFFKICFLYPDFESQKSLLQSQAYTSLQTENDFKKLLMILSTQHNRTKNDKYQETINLLLPLIKSAKLPVDLEVSDNNQQLSIQDKLKNFSETTGVHRFLGRYTQLGEVLAQGVKIKQDDVVTYLIKTKCFKSLEAYTQKFQIDDFSILALIKYCNSSRDILQKYLQKRINDKKPFEVKRFPLLFSWMAKNFNLDYFQYLLKLFGNEIVYNEIEYDQQIKNKGVTSSMLIKLILARRIHIIKILKTLVPNEKWDSILLRKSPGHSSTIFVQNREISYNFKFQRQSVQFRGENKQKMPIILTRRHSVKYKQRNINKADFNIHSKQPEQKKSYYSSTYKVYKGLMRNNGKIKDDNEDIDGDEIERISQLISPFIFAFGESQIEAFKLLKPSADKLRSLKLQQLELYTLKYTQWTANQVNEKQIQEQMREFESKLPLFEIALKGSKTIHFQRIENYTKLLIVCPEILHFYYKQISAQKKDLLFDSESQGFNNYLLAFMARLGIDIQLENLFFDLHKTSDIILFVLENGYDMEKYLQLPQDKTQERQLLVKPFTFFQTQKLISHNNRAFNFNFIQNINSDFKEIIDRYQVQIDELRTKYLNQLFKHYNQDNLKWHIPRQCFTLKKQNFASLYFIYKLKKHRPDLLPLITPYQSCYIFWHTIGENFGENLVIAKTILETFPTIGCMGKFKIMDDQLSIVDTTFEQEKDSDFKLEDPSYQKLKGKNQFDFIITGDYKQLAFVLAIANGVFGDPQNYFIVEQGQTLADAIKQTIEKMLQSCFAANNDKIGDFYTLRAVKFALENYESGTKEALELAKKLGDPNLKFDFKASQQFGDQALLDLVLELRGMRDQPENLYQEKDSINYRWNFDVADFKGDTAVNTYFSKTYTFCKFFTEDFYPMFTEVETFKIKGANIEFHVSPINKKVEILTPFMNAGYLTQEEISEDNLIKCQFNYTSLKDEKSARAVIEQIIDKANRERILSLLKTWIKSQQEQMNGGIKEGEKQTKKFTLANIDFIKNMTPEEAVISNEIITRYVNQTDDFLRSGILQKYVHIDLEYIQESQMQKVNQNCLMDMIGRVFQQDEWKQQLMIDFQNKFIREEYNIQEANGQKQRIFFELKNKSIQPVYGTWRHYFSTISTEIKCQIEEFLEKLRRFLRNDQEFMNLVFFDWQSFYENLPVQNVQFGERQKLLQVANHILHENGNLIYTVTDQINKHIDENSKRLRGFCIAVLLQARENVIKMTEEDQLEMKMDENSKVFDILEEVQEKQQRWLKQLLFVEYESLINDTKAPPIYMKVNVKFLKNQASKNLNTDPMPIQVMTSNLMVDSLPMNEEIIAVEGDDKQQEDIQTFNSNCLKYFEEHNKKYFQKIKNLKKEKLLKHPDYLYYKTFVK